MKAPFAYFGGKSGLASTIVAMMPPHRVYIEVIWTNRPIPQQPLFST